MSGGVQNHGFKGLSVGAMRAPCFLQGDGGWNRIVWIPKEIKLEIADAIPEEVYDRIATEEDAIDPADLEVWLREKKHPVVEKYWKDSKPVPLKIPMPNQPWEDEMWEEKS